MYTILGKPECPYCERAKELAKAKDLRFEYIDITTDAKALLKAKDSGMTTVPVILKGETLIGGFEDFWKHTI